jgi:putative ABC transport system permease protein
VVAIFVITLALAQGFRATLVASGLPGNAIVLRKGATSENLSGVPVADVPLVESLPQVARGADGQPLVSPELLVIISRPRTSDGQPANVPLRGVGERTFRVRDTVRVVEGRRFTPGLAEVVVGRLAASRFRGLEVGKQIRFGNAAWTVVGMFAAGDASYESEVWGDVNLMMPAFQRSGYQSLTVRLTDPSAFDSFAAALEADNRLELGAQREQEYYAAQSRLMTTMIRILGTFVTLILSIGAMFGAMNTMYAAVAYRIREIGTLRALGFSRLRIMGSFVVESVALALVGGVIGCLLALPVHGISTGTTNWTSFSEVAFKFRITPALLVGGLIFAAIMGALGGLLPAIRAARTPIARALREI